MKRHPALPETYTPEKLGVWFTENAVDKRTHTEEQQLTEKDILEYKEKIANSTAAIYTLKDVEKAFKESLNKGTPFNGQEREPESFTIPPTKGLKDLEANREFFDKVLKQGFVAHDIELFGIPYKKKIVFFDVTGKEFFDENMTPEQLAGAGQLFSEATTTAINAFKTTVKRLQKDGSTVSMSINGEPLEELFPENSEDPKPLFE